MKQLLTIRYACCLLPVKKMLTRTAATSLLLPKHGLNVSYGADHFKKLDAYLPPAEQPLPLEVIILIHGGLEPGDKADFKYLC